MRGLDLLSTLFGRASKRAGGSPAQALQDEVGVTVRYRLTLVSDIQRWHADASEHMRTLLDACRDKDLDQAVKCLQRFAAIFRQIGLARSVLLCPYLRWALQRDRAATIQFESAYGELMRSTMLIEVILTDYLGSPWDSDRRRRFVHVVVRLASLFSRGMELENTALLSIYLPPGQYRYVTDPASTKAREPS